jgi:glycosyltransferase involved in cell wall biosynthesis
MSELSKTDSPTDVIEVSAVMPCLNEERTLAACIEKALLGIAELGARGEVVVADNGSTDRSVEIATLAGARVIHVPVRGYGAALRAGIAGAHGQIVVMADADDSYDWTAIAPFVRKIREGFDLVMGNRFQGGIVPGAMPVLHRYLGNPVLSLIARIAFRIPIGDFHCGMRAFTKVAFERIAPRTTGMELATEIVANAAHQGLRVTEIPVVLHPDKRDRPPHLRTFRDGWRHLRFILTYAPDYLYLVPGVLFFGIGTVLMALLASGATTIGGLYFGIHFLALGSLLTLVGFNVASLGVLAKAVMARRYDGLRSRTIGFFLRPHALEVSLIVGAAMAAIGLVLDIRIVSRWIAARGAPMDDTIHLAFTASTVVVLGLNIIFSAFLLNMLLAEGRDADR